MAFRSLQLLALLLLFNSHVVAASSGINPNTLRPSTTPASFILGSKYSYTVKLRGLAATYTVPPGVYAAELIDAHGVFLRCSEKCVEIKLIMDSPQQTPNVMYNDGGVYVSDTGAKIYFYRASGTPASTPRISVQQVTPGSAPTASVATGVGAGIATGIINLIIKAGQGYIHFPDEEALDPVLKGQLRAVN